MALKHAGPGEVVNLGPLGEALSSSKTVALAKSDRFEAVRLVLPAGTTIPSHKVEGPITLYCIEGRTVISSEGDIDLSAGDWVYLERGIPHSLQAVEDSSLLLTILFANE